MTTLELITRLIVAVNTNDLRATPCLLAQLEARLRPEELWPILEAVLGEQPAPAPSIALARTPVPFA